MQNENTLFYNIGDYPLYLSDESRLKGRASTISFPGSEDEIVGICSFCYKENIPITIQGSRTGITGGAVPFSGHVINLSGMKKIKGLSFDKKTGRYAVSVEPGVTLDELRNAIGKKEFDTNNWSPSSVETLERFKRDGDWFFPTDPTETTASIGGMVACNASGARSFRYGSIRYHVSGISIVLADGRRGRVNRHSDASSGRRFSIALSNGSWFAGMLPSYEIPKVKNAAGYFTGDGIDLVDLFIGSEGTLAVVSAIDCMLTEKPKSIFGITVFFPDLNHGIGYVKAVRGDNGPLLPLIPDAIEFFDSNSLRFMESMRMNNEAFSYVPDIPGSAGCAIYTEFHCDDKLLAEKTLDLFPEFIKNHGGDENSTWFADTQKELDTLSRIRHSVPEAVNLRIDSIRKDFPEVTKLGTDMAVPNEHLAEIVDMYTEALTPEKLDYVMFGHIGNNHLHVNILPKTPDEYVRGKALYEKWAKRVIARGGTVSAEHGIGKIKVGLLSQMYGGKYIDEMKRLKTLFDPLFLLNRGNLFGSPEDAIQE